MEEFIAEKSIDARDHDGGHKQLRFALKAPVRIDDVSWGCELTMEGLNSKPHDVVGEDAWQALCLALGTVEQLLTYFVEDGGKLYWPGSSTEMAISDVIHRFVHPVT